MLGAPKVPLEQGAEALALDQRVTDGCLLRAWPVAHPWRSLPRRDALASRRVPAALAVDAPVPAGCCAQADTLKIKRSSEVRVITAR